MLNLQQHINVRFLGREQPPQPPRSPAHQSLYRIPSTNTLVDSTDNVFEMPAGLYVSQWLDDDGMSEQTRQGEYYENTTMTGNQWEADMEDEDDGFGSFFGQWKKDQEEQKRQNAAPG